MLPSSIIMQPQTCVLLLHTEGITDSPSFVYNYSLSQAHIVQSIINLLNKDYHIRQAQLGCNIFRHLWPESIPVFLDDFAPHLVKYLTCC
jgi:hypothetical protein